MSKKNHIDNKAFAWIITLISTFIILSMVIIWLGSCNVPKQSLKRSNKLFYKALNKSLIATSENCGTTFPTIDSINERVVYINGEPVITHDTIVQSLVEVINDTVYKTKFITKTVNQVDTVERVKYVQETNTALLTACKEKQEKFIADISKRTQQRNTWRLIAIALGSLWLLWLIKKIWFK